MEAIGEKVPEIYYDAIARVVPGTALVIIYSAHNLQIFQGLGSALIALVLGYVLGFGLELFSGTLLDPVLLGVLRNSSRFGIIDSRLLWKHLRSDACLRKPQFLKRIAERSLFRTLTFASLLALIRPPEILSGNRLPVCFALLIFLHGFYRVWRSLSSRVLEATNPQDQNATLPGP